MPDYPGVDPDGLTPGGLQIAGKVNAGALAVLGQAVIPAVFDWGTWSGDTGISVPHGTTVLLPWDSEDKPLKEVTFSNPDTKVTFNTAGTYLGLAVVFKNTNNSVSGFIQSRFVLSAGTQWFNVDGLPFIANDPSSMLLVILCDVIAGATLSVNLQNNFDADDTFGADIAIARLA